MPYQLKKDGLIVQQVIGEFQAPNGKTITRYNSVTGYTGDVFDNLPDHLIERIDSGELDEVWSYVEPGEDAVPPDTTTTEVDEAEKAAEKALKAAQKREAEDAKKAAEASARQQDQNNAPVPFDPDAHKLEDVLAHLNASDDAEIERVKAAEASGKGRTGIAQFSKESS